MKERDNLITVCTDYADGLGTEDGARRLMAVARTIGTPFA